MTSEKVLPTGTYGTLLFNQDPDPDSHSQKSLDQDSQKHMKIRNTDNTHFLNIGNEYRIPDSDLDPGLG